MKVLQINSVYGVGSTGRIVADLAKVIEDNGLECYVAYGYGNEISDPKFYRIQNNIYLKYNIAKTRLFGKHGFYNINATKKLIKWIEEIKPNVIHLHNIHGHYINIDLLFNYIKRENINVVWTLHDCWSFTGHCAYFDYIKCEKWKKECFNCPQLKSYPKSLFFDRSNESYHLKKKLFNSIDKLTVVTPSYWLANLVKESYLKNYDIKVINNGIDLNVFKKVPTLFKKKYGLENKKIILGVAMGFEYRKGYETFLKLSKVLKDNFHIVLVGVTEEQKQKLPNNVLGISKTNNVEELCEIYSAADVFINPTLEDNFPTVNLEALACGIPVITFNTGGSPECVDKLTGEIVERENIDGLIKSIYRVINSPMDYKNNCISKAVKNYNKNEKYNEYIKLYKGIKL